MKKYTILISVFNDWESVFNLLKKIDIEIIEWNAEISILIINDSSTQKMPKFESNFKNIKLIRVMNMKINKGHARCNAAGLKFLTENEELDYIILMDGDGEDRPEELTSLWKKSIENPLQVITANRVNRSEGVFFKFLYKSHKILTYIFTGKLIKFGNYSCLPKQAALNLSKQACLWSSFSGSVVKNISDRSSIPSVRGSRYFGPSKMNLFSLFIHSFSIIAVFKNIVFIRAAFFLAIYFFFVHSSLSFVTLFPVLIILIFLVLILKVSSRENIEELNDSLKNIDSIDILSDLNNR